MLTQDEMRRLHKLEQADAAEIIDIESPICKLTLTSRSRPLAPSSPGAGQLIRYMDTTARQHGGMGIAAVQIGIPVRLVLLRRRHGETGDLFQPFFNPHISHQSRRQIASWENCLSVPWGYRFTLRPERIRIRYQSDTGITQRETLYGEEAVVFQQETDHLDGKLLNHHYSKAWFIPNNEIEEFARDSSRQCQNLFRQQCNRQMKSLWKSRAKSEAKPR